MTSKNKTVKIEINIFSKEFIKNAEHIERKSEIEFILYTTEGLVCSHKVHYKLFVGNFEVRMDISIDDETWIYNCTAEEEHKKAFRYLANMEFDLRQKNMEDNREEIIKWLRCE
jgi:ABC-type proline/glycine betaine transport system substrate-binding protein